MYLTVRQNQRFVGIYSLDDAEVGRGLQGQLDAFPLEDAHELDVIHDHFDKRCQISTKFPTSILAS